ncbi:Methyl farnesoate epoxidase [Orchesella cincta]|uniref:Methyl farnesoate epoxidase n=1 Tax=Orchesella cincta TaxID=48709 RepID=A0A1D2MJ63_ORCCI|nr:Methyl farnesoate epoxidase [Orchesella cincta]
MIDFFTTFFIVCIALILWWIVEDRRSTANLPPGPPRLPIIGSLLSITFKSELPSITLANLSKIYGDVVHVKMGMSSKVVFSTYEAAKEILDHDKANETDLVGIIGDRNMHQNMGIVWASEEVWRTLRRFTIRTLRDFGFGKAASMDVVINEELVKFLRHFNRTLNSNNDNKMLVTKELFAMSALNVLWRLVTGKSYELGNERLKELLRLSNEFVNASTYCGDISTIFPTLRDWLPDYFTGRKRIEKCIQKLRDFARIPKRLLMYSLQKEENQKSNLNDEQLIYTLLDLFQGGADTSSNTLTFALLYLTLYPDIQNKVHEELDAVISKDAVITVEMKSKLPYCSATLLETLRYSSVIPFAPNRVAVDDFQFRNYTIKKGTTIMVNLHGLNVDEQIWGDPLVFRPERFLTQEGEIDKGMAELVMALEEGDVGVLHKILEKPQFSCISHPSSDTLNWKRRLMEMRNWLLPQSQLLAWDTQQNRLKQRLPEKSEFIM